MFYAWHEKAFPAIKTSKVVFKHILKFSKVFKISFPFSFDYHRGLEFYYDSSNSYVREKLL